MSDVWSTKELVAILKRLSKREDTLYVGTDADVQQGVYGWLGRTKDVEGTRYDLSLQNKLDPKWDQQESTGLDEEGLV